MVGEIPAGRPAGTCGARPCCCTWRARTISPGSSPPSRRGHLRSPSPRPPPWMKPPRRTSTRPEVPRQERLRAVRARNQGGSWIVGNGPGRGPPAFPALGVGYRSAVTTSGVMSGGTDWRARRLPDRLARDGHPPGRVLVPLVPLVRLVPRPGDPASSRVRGSRAPTHSTPGVRRTLPSGARGSRAPDALESGKWKAGSRRLPSLLARPHDDI